MDYKLEDLIDIPLIQNLLDKLNLIYSFPSAIVDNDGKILTAVAWQDICTKFHRTNPQCEKECIKSDKYISEHLHEANPAVSYQCPHGLVDNAAPIIIDGKHLGNFFTGQFFLEKPDLEFFKKQAKIYGFEEKAYLEAVGKVPIRTKEKLNQYLDFIKGFIEIIAGTGLKSIKEIEANKALKESEERNQAIIHSSSDWVWEIDELGKYCYCSDRIEQILGFTVDEIIGKSPLDLMPLGEKERVGAIFQNIVETKGSIVDLENWNLHKDGHKVCLLTNGIPLFDKTGKIKGYRGTDKDITERKQAEEKLQQSEDKYRTIVENVGEGIGFVNPEEQFILANKAAEEIFGVSSGGLLGMNLNDFVSDEQYKLIQQETAQRVKGNKSVYEIEIIRQDGEKRVIIVTAVPQKDKEGGFLGTHGVFRDITERIQTEENFRKDYERHQYILRTAMDGFCLADKQGHYREVNEAYCRMTGYSMAELLTMSISDFMISEEADANATHIQNIIAMGEDLFESRHRRKDGSIFDVEISAQYQQGDGDYFVTFLKDISERKQAEKALKESEALYRDLIFRMPDGVYKSTHEGKFVEVNPAMFKMLGYGSKEELIAIDIKTQLYFEPDDRESIILEETMQEMGVYRLKKKDGTELWVEDHGWYNLDNNGNIRFHEGIMRDITDRKLAEKEITLKNQELIKISAEKDKFFSIIAHDLRSPFNVFLGLTRIMVEDLPSLKLDEIQKIALTLRNSASNLYRLLENLLAWATIKQGIIPFNPEILHLLSVVEESITTVIEPASNKGIELTFDIPAGLEVYADSNILHTVLRNLISNALKFTHKGGKICVSAKIKGDKCVEISIKDSGIGMSSTMIDSLFQLDVQSGRSGTEGEPTTGLGLILCEEFIEKHGGKIRIESEEGKGSVFSFTLPQQLNPQGSNPQGFKNLEGLKNDKKQINSEASGLKILIAEDDENSRILLSMAVRKLSKKIITVITGVEAVEACHNNPDIDLILMDVQMPEMDGYEATRQIRQFNTSVIIIAQTAYGLTGEREKAIEAGCNDYIAKPVKKVELLELIKKYFLKSVNYD